MIAKIGYKYIIIFAIICILILGGVVFMKRNTSTAEAVEINLDKLDKAVQKEISNNPSLVYSSNPYDYIQNNEYYDKIVEWGVVALPELEKTLKESESNGLNEYIIAIAMEEISKVDVNAILGNIDYGWGTAKEFAEEWTVIKDEVEDDVISIIQSNDLEIEEKVEKISNYGVLAVPVIDSYSSSNEVQDSADLMNELTNLISSYQLNSEQVRIVTDYIGN